MLTKQLRAHLIAWFGKNLEELKEARLNTESMAELEAALHILKNIAGGVACSTENALLDKAPELLTVFLQPQRFQPAHIHSATCRAEVRQYLEALCAECLNRLKDHPEETLTELKPIVSAVDISLSHLLEAESSIALVPHTRRTTTPPVNTSPTYPWGRATSRPSSAPTLWESSFFSTSVRGRSSTIALLPREQNTVKLPIALAITAEMVPFKEEQTCYTIVFIGEQRSRRNEIKLLLKFTGGLCRPDYISIRNIESRPREDSDAHFKGAHFILFGGNDSESIAPWLEDCRRHADARAEQLYYIHYRYDSEGKIHPNLVPAHDEITLSSVSTAPELAQQVLIEISSLAINFREEISRSLGPRP